MNRALSVAAAFFGVSCSGQLEGDAQIVRDFADVELARAPWTGRSEAGAAISRASVRLASREFRSGEYITGRGISDKVGMYDFVGGALDRVAVEATLVGTFPPMTAGS